MSYAVYKLGTYPKPKKHFYPNEFEKRRQAINFCYKRSWEVGLTIVHPDGTEEIFTNLYRDSHDKIR